MSALSGIDRTEPQQAARIAVRAAADKKGNDIRVLDLGQLLAITDYFVIVSAANERQLGSIAEEMERQLRESGRRPVRREGTKESGWVLLDYGDVVLHVFSEEQRRFYALERLWGDAPELSADEVVGSIS